MRRLAFAAAAESLLGTAFRFRGRDIGTGIDCVGLVALALERIGSPAPNIAPYAMRQRDFAAQLLGVDQAGFRAVDGPLEPGDLLLLRPGSVQVHLAIVGSAERLIHAHAGLGRVVATPPPFPWPIERQWRLRDN